MIEEAIAAWYGISLDQLKDVVPFMKDWNLRDFWNALSERWDKFTICNPPYSQCIYFLLKGIYEYRLGNNIVFIIKRQSFDSKNFQELAEKIATVLWEGSLRFEPYETPLDGTIIIFGLLQPETLIQIEEKGTFAKAIQKI